MFLATSNKNKRLLCVTYAGVVNPEQLAAGRAELTPLLAELPPGFRVLVNLSQLETMDIECQAEIGLQMEAFDRAGVSLIVRVIPDESKDIGLNILTVFHYSRHPQVATCRNLTEAAGVLAL